MPVIGNFFLTNGPMGTVDTVSPSYNVTLDQTDGWTGWLTLWLKSGLNVMTRF